MTDKKEAMHEVEQASEDNKDAATLMNEWSTETIPSANCEGESKTAVDYKDAKVNVIIKMLRNLCRTLLICIRMD